MVPSLKVFTGSTSVSIFHLYEIDLSYMYLLYLILLGIYFTNTINIYAGINGLEVGQSIVAASSQLILFTVRYVSSPSSPSSS